MSSLDTTDQHLLASCPNIPPARLLAQVEIYITPPHIYVLPHHIYIKPPYFFILPPDISEEGQKECTDLRVKAGHQGGITLTISSELKMSAHCRPCNIGLFSSGHCPFFNDILVTHAGHRGDTIPTVSCELQTYFTFMKSLHVSNIFMYPSLHLIVLNLPESPLSLHTHIYIYPSSHSCCLSKCSPFIIGVNQTSSFFHITVSTSHSSSTIVNF